MDVFFLNSPQIIKSNVDLFYIYVSLMNYFEYSKDSFHLVT